MESVQKIRTVLGIEREAVGVKYTDESPSATLAQGQYAVCSAILAAASGEVIMLSKGTCACPGGKSHIGLVESREIPLKMLVEGEKLWSDVKTATRSRIETQKIALPPLGIAGKVYVTVGDISARRPDGWDKGIMIATFPTEKIRGVADAIDKSTAGTAKSSDQFEALIARMKALKK